MVKVSEEQKRELMSPRPDLPEMTLRKMDSRLQFADKATNFKPIEQRKYDLVMFGATGFTGKLACEYIAKNYPQLKWAIAGRSKDRLKEIRSNLAIYDSNLENMPILLADTQYTDQLEKIVNDSRVVISTVGPYAKYGTNLVGMCCMYGTHYADITGEVAWVRQMIEQFDSLAAKTGAMIINSCGCDSIPWDLLTFAMADKMQSKHKQGMQVVAHSDYMNGNMSGGTFTTLQYSLSNPPPKSKLGYDPLIKKIGVDEKVDTKFKPMIQRYLSYNGLIKKFVGMWALADGNAGIVKRSNALLNYSHTFTYQECLVFPNFFAGFNAYVQFLFLGTLLAVPPVLKFVEPYLFPMPGQGPTEEQMDAGFLRLESIGKGEKGAVVKGQIIFPNDPGYRDTARMLVETGLAMALDQNKIKVKGGFWTPSSGLGHTLINRLVDSGSSLLVE